MAVARYTCDEMLNSSTFMARRHGMTSGHELVNCFHGGDTTNDAGHRLVLYCTSLLEDASDGASSRFNAGVASLQAKGGVKGAGQLPSSALCSVRRRVSLTKSISASSSSPPTCLHRESSFPIVAVARKPLSRLFKMQQYRNYPPAQAHHATPSRRGPGTY
jgi:hypothetical protein